MTQPDINKDITNEELFNKICRKIDNLETKFEKTYASLAAKVDSYGKIADELKKENIELKNKVEQLENKLRRNNIVVYGLNIEDNIKENTVSQIKNLLDVEINQWDLNNVRKIGQETNKQRPILVELNNISKKQEILKNCYKLKGKGVYINNDMSQENLKKHKLLRKYLNKAKQENTSTYIKGNALIIQGEQVTYEDLVLLENKEGNKQEGQSQEKSKKEKKKGEKITESSAPSTSSILSSLRSRK